MHIVFITHPFFLGSQSMPRFAAMLTEGMQQRGHQTEVWAPNPIFYKLPVFKGLKKWAGYIDQYLVFPAQVRSRLKACPANTLFVFTDQALGPWVPLVKNRPHIIHCHDFLAQLSAFGEIQENPTGKTGKVYQNYIRRGYMQGKSFLSVSNKTQEDLHLMLERKPELSEVVYNGFNRDFEVINVDAARTFIIKDAGIDVSNGYLLHVGGNQWYKNRTGVIEIYNEWRNNYHTSLPLLMIGAVPNEKLLDVYNNSPYKKDIYLLAGKSDSFVKQAYCGASIFLFPSLAEGFGWPIAEAMASGIPVITTDKAPMTEVGGSAAYYISRKCYQSNDINWANDAARVVNKVLNLSTLERSKVIDCGIENAKRFDSQKSLDNIENFYKTIVAKSD
jgi:glycosyltransferase involved in cell wall biosynthesis